MNYKSVDINKFKPNGETYNSKLTKPIIISVAALTETKKLELVIEAVSKLDKGSLLIVGDGHLKNKLKVLAQKVLPGRFGMISAPHSQMPSIYRSLFQLVNFL